MSLDPEKIIGEVLGEPAARMRNPVNADNQCPYISGECIKRFHGISGAVPVCSIWRWKGKVRSEKKGDLICVCPKRFFAIDLVSDVIANCWKGPPPANPQLVHEVRLGKPGSSIGNVDCVLADVDEKTGKVKEFVSIELQAVDITGSYLKAYEALLNSQQLEVPAKFGFNFANVYKRFVTQLIAKGYYHALWKTKIIAVVQDVVFEDILRRSPFQAAADVTDSSVVFMVYKFVPDTDNQGAFKLVLDKAVGTTHTQLQMALLYRALPAREEFCANIEVKL